VRGPIRFHSVERTLPPAQAEVFGRALIDHPCHGEFFILLKFTDCLANIIVRNSVLRPGSYPSDFKDCCTTRMSSCDNSWVPPECIPGMFSLSPGRVNCPSGCRVCLVNSRNIDRRRAPPYQWIKLRSYDAFRVMHSSALDAARHHSGLDGAAIGAGNTCSLASSKPVRVVLHRRRKLRLLCFAQTPVASRWVCVVLQPISFFGSSLAFLRRNALDRRATERPAV